MDRFNPDIKKVIQSMSKTEYNELEVQSKQYSNPVTEQRRPFNDECVHFNHALPSLKQRTMLFEKIYFLIESNRKREQRQRGTISSKSFVSDMKLDTSNWELQKKIIQIIRAIYLR